MNRTLRRWTNRAWARLHGQTLPTWYHVDYRLPMTSISGRTGFDTRRADLAAWTLLELGAIRRRDLRTPARIRLRDLARVHDPAYLESLVQEDALSRIFAVDAWDLRVGEVLESVRLACGGTLAAAREVLENGSAALNLVGGMHHAAPDRGAGFCPVNDIAVAIATLRAEGYDGVVGVLDLDAHPPDGTAACLEHDERSWIASISGSDWGPLPGRVDEIVLAQGTGDPAYLAALDALLARCPDADLLFVLAGGDVRGEDPIGELGLTEAGVRQRDARVAAWRGTDPAVWLPAGGYGNRAWRVLVHTGFVLASPRAPDVPEGFDPLRNHLHAIARDLRDEDLEGDAWFTEADVAEMMGIAGRGEQRLLGFYTAPGIELAFQRYGLLEALDRLGYAHFRVIVDRTTTGDRMRVVARAAGDPPPARPSPGAALAEGEMLLVEVVVAKETGADGAPLLFVHWMTLRHPLAEFRAARPQLPGQEVPGLGMAREAGQLLGIMAQRLGLSGVAVRPAWYHVAYASRYHFRFEDPAVQGRFEALSRDLAEVPLRARTHAIADGRVRDGDAVFAWEPGRMVATGAPPPEGWREESDRVRDACHFTVVPEAG
jgi:acetoin utilization deacetylase AcuC-like enzyme